MKKILLFICATICCMFLSAQTYETEEMRLKAEKEIAEKNEQLGIVESKEAKKESETKEIFDETIVADAYQLEYIKAIDYDKKHSNEKMKDFQQEMKTEIYDTEMYVSDDLTYFYRINKSDRSQYSVMEVEENDNTINYINCEKCNEEPFQIIEHTSDVLILETPAQDEGSFYTVHLIFKK